MSQINVDIIRSRTGTAATCDKGLVVSGVTTSTSFTGDVTGDVTGNTSGTAGGLSGSPDITIGNLTGVAGTYSGVVKVTDTTEATSTTTGSVIITGGVGIAKSLFVGGNISVGGTLTYEDVQNVDSIGIVTARSGIEFGVAGVGGTITGLGHAEFVGIVTASGLDAAISVWTLGASGTNHYTFTGPGNLSTTSDPTLQLIRGQKYIFKNRSGGHPFRIQSTVNGSAGTQYNTGVTNNDAGNGTDLIFDVPYDAPSVLYYQCTAHANMGGAIYIGSSSGDNVILAGICTVSQGTDLNGYKVEEGNSDTSTALSGEFDFELENGHVQRYSTATGGNYFPDFRVSSSQSLNSVMDVGDVISVTLMVASSSHYCTTGIKIDNSTSNLDIDWIGGSAPSAANGSGYDIYAFTIQKTGAAPAYHIIGNALGAA